MWIKTATDIVCEEFRRAYTDLPVDEVIVVTNKVSVVYPPLFKTHQHVLDWHETQAEYL